MLNVKKLLTKVGDAGFQIDITSAGPVLRPAGPGLELSEWLMEAVKANRDAVVTYLSTCSLCGRDTRSLEDRQRLADPLFCDRGGAGHMDYRAGHWVEDELRCPYKTGR